MLLIVALALFGSGPCCVRVASAEAKADLTGGFAGSSPAWGAIFPFRENGTPRCLQASRRSRAAWPRLPCTEFHTVQSWTSLFAGVCDPDHRAL